MLDRQGIDRIESDEANMETQTISLDHIPAHRRFRDWQEIASELYVPVALSCDAPETFRFSSDWLHVADVQTGVSLMTPLQVERNHRHIKRSSTDDVKIVIPTSGRIAISQDGREASVGADGFYICDPTRPYQEAILKELRFEFLLLPRAPLAQKVPLLEQVTATDFSGSASPYAGLFRDFVLSFSRVRRCMDAPAAAHATMIAQDLLTMALWEHLGRIKTHSSENRRAQFHRAKAILDARFTDAELDMTIVAQSIGVSTRHLRSLFAEIGLSYREYVHTQRLEHGARALSNASLRTRGITEIALMSGFDNPAYFSRAFKSRYGLAPKDYRAMKISS